MFKAKGGRNQQSFSVTPQRDTINIDSGRDTFFEPVQTELYAVSYTIFLIPEMLSFQLAGEMVELLPEWSRQICVSNGWKLEFAVVDSRYLQLALSVSPAFATGPIIQHVRSKLTEQIILALDEEIGMHASVDFWAHGYLLLYGLHPHSSEIIDRYIRMIRWQQQK